MAKDNKTVEQKAEQLEKTSKDVFNLLDSVKPINEIDAEKRAEATRTLNQLNKDVKDKLKEGQKSQAALDVEEGQTLAVELLKSTIKANYPSLYDAFENLNYSDYVDLMNRSGILEDQKMTSTQRYPFEYNQQTVQISPQMFWNNTTTILNSVNVSSVFLDFGETFNAFTFFNDGPLVSGISKLYTQEYAAVGVQFLDQNQLVPASSNGGKNATQNVAGYQVSHPVFANLPYSEAGDGLGYGLFARANLAENVWKLSVTSPAEFAQMNYQFVVLMNNSKEMAIWAIATNNFLNGFTNILVDNANTNIRDVLNGTVYPNILGMTTLTDRYNIGDTVELTYTEDATGNVVTKQYTPAMSVNELKSVTAAKRLGRLQSPYFVDGYQQLSQIASTKAADIHVIMTPATRVTIKSGLLSVLYNYQLQNWGNYISENNTHLLWLKPTIKATYLNPADPTQLAANLIPVRMDQEWITDFDFYVFAAPSDPNRSPATYGYVWDDLWENIWGAAMIKTQFKHFLIYGGTTPWAQGFRIFAKNLPNPLALENKAPVKLFFPEGVTVSVVAPAA